MLQGVIVFTAVFGGGGQIVADVFGDIAIRVSYPFKSLLVLRYSDSVYILFLESFPHIVLGSDLELGILDGFLELLDCLVVASALH